MAGKGGVERAIQFSLGGEFGEALDEFSKRAVGAIPGLENYAPLAMWVSYNSRKGGLVSFYKTNANGKERQVMILPNLASFKEFCGENKVRGMVLVVDNLGLLPFPDEETLKRLFEGKGKVSAPENYKIWIVDKSLALFPVEPKEEWQKKELEKRKEVVKRWGLVGVCYRHNAMEQVGWFEARFPKRRQVQERDLNQDPRIRFLKRWAEKVAEYRGARVVDDSALREKIGRSRNYSTTMRDASELNGVVLEYPCGCRVEIVDGQEQEIIVCDKDCKRGERNCKSPIKLGEWMSVDPRCGDCGEGMEVKNYWYDIDSFTLFYEMRCKGMVTHGYKNSEKTDPGRILNPLYIYYSLKKRKGERSGKGRK